MPHNNRIEWIDAMRGFSMMLVVFGHVLLYMGLGGEETFLSSFLMSFRMPLFFFVSGFFSFRAIDWWNKRKVMDIVGRKVQAQIISTALFFAVFQFATTGTVSFSNGFGSYWFTIVLFQMYLIYLILSLASRMLKRNFVDLSMIILSLAGILISTREIPSELYKILCGVNLCHYLQFFTLGILCNKYRNRFFSLISKDIVRTITIIGVIICVLLWNCSRLESDFFVAYYLIRYEITKYLSLLLVIMYFHGNASLYSNGSRISNTMKYIGRRTLDIYFIHFFFLPDLMCLKEYLIEGDMITIQILVSSLITTCILALSCLISSVLRQSDTLGAFLFGLKRSKPNKGIASLQIK